MSFLNFRVAGSCCASKSPATASRQTRRRILNSNTKAQLQAKEFTVQACWESQPVQTPYVPLFNHLDLWTRPRKTVQTNGDMALWSLPQDGLCLHLAEIFCKSPVITSILYKVQCPLCTSFKIGERKMFQTCI